MGITLLNINMLLSRLDKSPLNPDVGSGADVVTSLAFFYAGFAVKYTAKTQFL